MDKEIIQIREGLDNHEARLEYLENPPHSYKEQLSPDDLQVLDYAMIESYVKKAVAKELHQILLRLESLEQAVYKQKKEGDKQAF